MPINTQQLLQILPNAGKQASVFASATKGGISLENLKNGISVLKYFESCSLTAHPDPATGGAPWTIGWGIPAQQVVPRARAGHQDQADAQLVIDLASREMVVSQAVTEKITQGQFDALVPFCTTSARASRA